MYKEVTGGQDERNNVEYSCPAVIFVCVVDTRDVSHRCEGIVRDRNDNYPARAEFESDVEAPVAGRAPVVGLWEV